MARLNVYLGLGSNLGNRLENISNGISMLSAQSHIVVKDCSSIYETEPWGYSNQPDFLNCVIRVRTSHEPIRLLSLVQSIETLAGRQPSFRHRHLILWRSSDFTGITRPTDPPSSHPRKSICVSASFRNSTFINSSYSGNRDTEPTYPIHI